jgi:hypothetical protein
MGTNPLAARNLLQGLAHLRRRYLPFHCPLVLPPQQLRIGHLHIFVRLVLRLASPLLSIALIFLAFTSVPILMSIRTWFLLQAQLLVPVQMRKFFRVVNERHLVGSVEWGRRGIAREGVERVPRHAAFLGEALPEMACFLAILLVWFVWAQEPSSTTAPPRASLASYDVLHFLFQAHIILSLVFPTSQCTMSILTVEKCMYGEEGVHSQVFLDDLCLC